MTPRGLKIIYLVLLSNVSPSFQKCSLICPTNIRKHLSCLGLMPASFTLARTASRFHKMFFGSSTWHEDVYTHSCNRKRYGEFCRTYIGRALGFRYSLAVTPLIFPSSFLKRSLCLSPACLSGCLAPDATWSNPAWSVTTSHVPWE